LPTVNELVIASIERAGNHLIVFGVVAVIGALWGLIYLIGKSRGPGA
jgi:hypothetical protein